VGYQSLLVQFDFNHLILFSPESEIQLRNFVRQFDGVSLRRIALLCGSPSMIFNATQNKVRELVGDSKMFHSGLLKSFLKAFLLTLLSILCKSDLFC